MACVTDADVTDWFQSNMEDIRNKLQACGEMVDRGIDLDTCSNKSKDDETLFETIQVYQRDLKQKNASMNRRRDGISQITSEVEKKDTQKIRLVQTIESLREEHVRSKELIVAQNKANKLRLKTLNKDRQVFQNQLGLEIKKIHGEKLQFIFRHINQADPDSVHTFLLRIDGDGTYKIEWTDPPLECMAQLEQRLQETTNFTAFIANVRKEFVSLSRT